MKRHFLTLLMAIIATTLSIKAQTIVIDDGFENGILDSIWTQECVVGQTLWAVEDINDNLDFPSTVWQGSKRAYLRNTTGETQGYVTRLVSKVMDLREVYQPELTFWYANPKWTADRDTLRVLYRTGEKAKWKQLVEFSSASANWQKVQLELPEYESNPYYQIAFEGTDNLGRGIVLDSVKLRSKPMCTIPKDFTVTNKGAGLVNIAWVASWDAVTYDMVISKKPIGMDTLANVPDSLIAANLSLPGGLEHPRNYDVQLESGEYYYLYMRSVCEMEVSDWSYVDPKYDGAYYFRVKATKNVPYHYPVDMPYQAGMLRRDLEWTWGNNTGNYNPSINTNTPEDSRDKYSHDGTTCIIFTGTNAVTTVIPANKYAYVATPALADSLNENFALNQCQVRFWTTVAGYTGRKYAHSLIVGAMTDPEDITTFVPMDTVSVWGTSTYVENVVSFASYQGDGNYVAFMSNFDTQNIFYLDDITVEYISPLRVPTNIRVNPRDTYADITWEGNASKYNVLITNREVNPDNPAADFVVKQAQVTTNSYKIEDLEANHGWNRPYYVYVQAVQGNDDSEWSYRYPFVTICQMNDIPFTYDFEQKSGVYTIGEVATMYPIMLGVFSNDPEYPHIVTSNAHGGASCMNLTKDWGNDSWMTLPIMADSLKNLQVKFYLSGSSTYAQAYATLGVMTNPMDINTFIPVSEFTLTSTGYTLCYANFLNYDGPEGIIAIAWADVKGDKQTVNYIDDVTVEPLQTCLPPVNVQYEAESDSVTISWDRSEAGAWEFVFASKPLSTTQLDDSLHQIAELEGILFADTLTWDDPTKDPTFGFDSLDYNTPYYTYVRTLCGEGEKPTWWVTGAFKTPCPDDFPIPFYEDFNSYAAAATEVGCWTLRNYGGTGYPKTLNLTSGAQSGIQLELWSTGTTHRCIAAVPGVAGNLSDMVLSFDTRSWSTSAKSVIYVGTMGDFDDPTSFVPLDTFYNADGNTFQKVRMNLADYTLAHNNIVFCSGLASELEMNSDVMIDNISIKPNTCIEAWQFEATDIQPNSIDIKWAGKSDNDQWVVTVASPKDTIVADSAVIGKAFHMAGLEPMTAYTFYVKPICDTVWSSVSYTTACVKLDPTKPNKEDFESITDATTSYKETSQIPCWTVGNANPSASTSYIPFVYKSTTYSSSGNNTYRAYGYSTTNSPAYIATPEIDCQSMTELAVTFNIYATTSYWWICGVMSDPTDLSTFVVLDSVKGTGASVQYTYDLSEYADIIPATAKYFAWRGRHGVTDYLYLDDVSIVKITCPLPKPRYSGLTDKQVRISSGLRTSNPWLLLVTTEEVKEEDLTPANIAAIMADSALYDSLVVYFDTIATPSQIVDGLKEQTDYYVAVATLCEDGISPIFTLSFKTPCSAITPEALGTIHFSKKEGYVAGSSATRYMPCWTVGNKNVTTATSTYIPYVCTTSTYLYSAQKDSVLRLYTYNSSSATNDGAYAVMPELAVDDISKYQVNFWARSNTSASYNNKVIIGVITDPTDLNTFVVVDTLTLSKTAYEPFSVSLEEYEGDYMGNKGRYIMFLNEFGFIGYTDVYIASISVEKIPTCRPVTEFSVDSIAEDAAVISWKQYSDSYRMLMADKEVAEDKKDTYDAWLIDSIVTNTQSVLISGLKPATQYYVYAQAMCDGGDSSAISMAYANILTDCPVINGYPVPYYNDFDKSPKTGSGNKPLCWDGVYMTMDTVSTSQTYPYVYTTASYAASTPYSMYMYAYGYWNNTDKKYTSNTKTYAVAPKVAGNLNDYMISFYARKGGTTVAYGNKLRVGYVTDASQRGIDTTFVKIADVEVTTATQQPYQVIISDYVNNIPAGARIALLADWSIQDYATPTANTSYYGTMYVDNFKIGMPPSCFPPKLEPVNTTLTTADVNIIPAKAWNDKWQLAVVPDSVYSKTGYDAADYLAGNDVRIVDADSANFTISGLDHSTLYWLYARTVCGGEDGNSAWTDLAVSARTKYYYADSYFFGFEQEEGWERSPLSTSDSYIMHPAVDAGYIQLGSAITSYSYMPHALITTSSGYNYGYGPSDWSMGKTGIRWNATSSYYGQYVIMPALNEAKDRSFEFKFRNGYSYISSNKYIVSTSYNVCIEVGTVDKYKGMETYQKLATISMDAYPSSSEATEANDWLWRSYTLDIDSATIADKQIVFFQAEKPSASNYPYIDNVKMGAPKGFGLVSIEKVLADATQATVTWNNIGGPWNLYILKSNGDTLKRYENLTATSQVVTGLKPQTGYTAVLVAANAPEDTRYYVKDTKDFRTPCEPIEPDAYGEFFWNFDDPNETEPNDLLAGAATDTAYLKPSCFTTGTTYTGSWSNGYQWLWQSKGHDYYSTLGNPSETYNHREIGYGDSYGSLRVYTTTTYTSQTVKTWIALPQLNCDLDTMMIEFWGRCLANQDETATSNAGKVLSTSYFGDGKLVIGTMTDPKDFSTLEIIDTVTYAVPAGITTSTLVSSDPTGNRYWQQFQLPLAGTNGKNIVLFQPYSGKTALFFVDNLKITPVGDNLFAPSGARTSDITANSATFHWTAKHPNIQTVVVVLDNVGDTVKIDTIPGSVMSYTMENLTPATTYQWSVYQTNGTVNTLSTGALQFYTECVPVGASYNTGFELIEGWKILPAQTSDTYKQTLCWTYENAGSSAVGTNIYNYANTSSYNYSHKGAYALRLYATGTTYQTYAAMPPVTSPDGLDTLQVNFWMRPGYASATTGKISTQYTLGSSAATKEYYYAKSVIVGTMTDPMDATTFVPIDTVTYNGTLSTSDVVNEANNYLFQPKKVALTGAVGPYVAFMATLYAKGAENKSTYDYVWIDDISFSPIQHCQEPEDLKAEDISATTAILSWTAPEGAEKYILQVSTDYTFATDTAFAFNDTVTTNTNEVTGLKAFTQYSWRVSTICGEDLGESSFSQNAVFTTARQPFFLENFGATDLEEGWTFATNSALSVLDSTDVELTGSNSTLYGWKRETAERGLPAGHYSTAFYSSSATTTTDYDYYWMISPTISLDNYKQAHLSFDIALTGCSGTYTTANIPATEASMADDYAFGVIISEDGGKTWKKDNILALWNNAIMPAGQQLRDIPFNGMNVRFDLKDYAGKNIRIAFYREAQTYKGTSPYTCAVHIDNIRVNYYVEASDNVAACQYHDIDALGFHIDGDKASAGDTTYVRMDNADFLDATTKGYGDTVVYLNVTYYEAPETLISATICDGETYTDENFHGKEKSGIYRRKMQSCLSCDSIVTLNLFVAPKKQTNEFDTICFGETKVWHDQTCDRTGLYYDTLKTIYGCDSVIILSLKVRDEITATDEHEICEGSSYTWGERHIRTYREAGYYKDTFTSVTGCDSIVTLHLIVSDIIKGDTLVETVCQGQTFTWNGVVYDKTGIYTDTLKAAYGCDSIATLDLTIAPIIVGPTVKHTICQGGSYEWNGKTYDKKGIYTDTLTTAKGCDSIASIEISLASIIIGEQQKVERCEGSVYIWNGKTYDKPGIYKDTIQSSGGCDSLATIILSFKSLIHGDAVNVSVCEGETFKWNSKELTKPGTYTDTMPSTGGCDSIATLVLMYYGAEDTIRTESTIALADLPFTYQNADHPYVSGQTPITYNVGTPVGVYSDTVKVEGVHCEAVMIHTLTILEKIDGLNDAQASDFELLPNIIRAGESVTARGNFAGMVHIQVYDIIGRLVKEERNSAASIIRINAFPQTGIYTVRISDSNGTQYVGKVLAK